MIRVWIVAALAAALVLGGCGGGDDEWASDAADRDAIEAKWGKSIDELPDVTLVAISPHNDQIMDVFEHAFRYHHALEAGQDVDIEWRVVSGGGNAIFEYLRNVYGQSDTSGISVLWGGGEIGFQELAAEGLLEVMTIPDGALANIPPSLGGVALRDPGSRWCGVVLSGFGLLYNGPRLTQLGRPFPERWDDLTEAHYYDLIAVADPLQSSSALTAFELIVQSGEDWQAGWAKLLAILGNAKRMYGGSSSAADAVVSEAAIATAIDFYGAMRVQKYPGVVTYVPPAGQSVVTPDPIAILKNAPQRELAQQFVDFVLSAEGQALWALPAEANRPCLFRMPIRKDAYQAGADRLAEGITNPYAAASEAAVDVEMKIVRTPVLGQLVHAAAVANFDGLKRARKAVIDSGFDPALVAAFNELPPNVRTAEQIAEVAAALTDEAAAERIATEWKMFFARKYAEVSD